MCHVHASKQLAFLVPVLRKFLVKLPLINVVSLSTNTFYTNTPFVASGPTVSILRHASALVPRQCRARELKRARRLTKFEVSAMRRMHRSLRAAKKPVAARCPVDTFARSHVEPLLHYVASTTIVQSQRSLPNRGLKT